MRHLFFDTETTGLPTKFSLDHPSQPRVVQFAGILTENEVPIRICSFLIHPEHVIIPQKVVDIHGITTEKARAQGIPLSRAIAIWQGLASLANVIVGHKVDFDLKMMAISEIQAKIKSQPLTKQIVCTMKEATSVVKALRSGTNTIKAPRLEECTKFFFQESLDGAHDALVDTKACMRVYYEMVRRNLIELPKIK